MVFDVTKLKEDSGVLDPDAASLDRRMPDPSASPIGLDATRSLLTGLSTATTAQPTLGRPAYREPTGLDNPFLQAFVGISRADMLEAVRPHRAAVQRFSASVDSPLLKTMAKFGSLAVAERQASTARNAAAMRGFVDSFRALDPMKESASSWESIHDVVLGKSAIKRATAVERFSVGQYGGKAFGFEQYFDISSFGFGAGAAQGFLRTYEPPWKATLEALVNPPLFTEIRKFAVGYATLAQRFGEWVESWSRPLAGVFERLLREVERWPLDPYGEPVPVHNACLYRLAIAAYEGDLVMQARFLNEIEAGDFPGDVSLVGDLLKPTFNPERPDRRKNWWLMKPAEARCWLRKRLRDIRIKKDSERETAERIYAQRERTERLQVEGKRIVRATARDMLDFDPDLIEFERRERETFLRQRIREMLPEILSERQHQIFWYLAQEMTLKEIADRLGLSESTIKVHAMRMRANLRANSELLQVLHLNGTLG